MKSFKHKQELYNYLINKFIITKGTILLRGSMVSKEASEFCDFDFEIYNDNPREPYYEIILLKNKISLITIWFEEYKEEREIVLPNNIKIIHGKYHNYMTYIEDNKEYKNDQKVKRESQSVVDKLFKYLRSKDKKILNKINQKIK